MLIIAFSGIAFYAPTALKARYVPTALIDVAAWFDVVVIGGVSVIVMLTMMVSVAVVLKMEGTKQCAPGGDLVRGQKVRLKAIFNEAACSVLFNSKTIDNDDDVGLVAPRHYKGLSDPALSVVPTTTEGQFDIRYRGVQKNVAWLTVPEVAEGCLGETNDGDWQSLCPFNLAVIHVECDDSGNAFAGGKVTLDGGAVFVNPAGGVIGMLAHKLNDFAFQMDPQAANLKAAEDVVNMKAVLKDSWYAPKCDIVLFLCVRLTMALPFVVLGSNTVLVRSQTGFFHKPSRTEIFTRTREY